MSTTPRKGSGVSTTPTHKEQTMYPTANQQGGVLMAPGAPVTAGRTNGGELVGLLQRAQKVAEYAETLASQSDNIDRVLGSQPEAASNLNTPPTADNIVANLHVALDRAERAISYTATQLSRLGTALA